MVLMSLRLNDSWANLIFQLSKGKLFRKRFSRKSVFVKTFWGIRCIQNRSHLISILLFLVSSRKILLKARGKEKKILSNFSFSQFNTLTSLILRFPLLIRHHHHHPPETKYKPNLLINSLNSQIKLQLPIRPRLKTIFVR